MRAVLALLACFLHQWFVKELKLAAAALASDERRCDNHMRIARRPL